MEDVKSLVGKIIDSSTEARQYQTILKQLTAHIGELDLKLKSGQLTKAQYDSELNKLFQGRDKDSTIKQLKDYINFQISQIEKNSDLIKDSLGQEIRIEPVKKEEKVNVNELMKLGIMQRKQFLKDINIDEELLEEFVKRAKKKKLTEVRVEYTVYKTTEYGMLANRFFGGITDRLVKNYPFVFENLYVGLRMSGLKVMSKTYISMILLNSVIGFLVAWLLLGLVWGNASILVQIFRAFGLGLVAAALTAGVSYFYPSSVAKEKESLIKNELPFVIVHMSAVAGSGAKPISIFSTILSTEEYPATKDEINKIVNYVNIFGYDLSTALKSVSRSAPSLLLKDLLNGIVNTIESGGDLKNFLAAAADDALNRYRLERQKYVEVIATYSDVYTALLIAAPLLFFVSLAIIQTMGGQIGGIPVQTIAIIGTYVVIPIMNVGYYFFVDIAVPQ